MFEKLVSSVSSPETLVKSLSGSLLKKIQDRLSSEGQFHMSDSVVDTSLEEEIETLEEKNSKRQSSSSGPMKLKLQHNDSDVNARQKLSADGHLHTAKDHTLLILPK